MGSVLLHVRAPDQGQTLLILVGAGAAVAEWESSLEFDHETMSSPADTMGPGINSCVPSAFGKPGRIGPTHKIVQLGAP